MALPTRLWIGPHQIAMLSEEPLAKGQHAVTAFEGEGVGIVINSRAPKPHRHLALLHELIHVAEEKLLRNRIIRRRSHESYVTQMATILFGMLALNGLWRGVTKAEAIRYYAERTADYELECRRRRARRASRLHSAGARSPRAISLVRRGAGGQRAHGRVGSHAACRRR